MLNIQSSILNAEVKRTANPAKQVPPNVILVFSWTLSIEY